MTLRSTLLGFALLLALGGCVTLPRSGADARFHAIYTEEWAWRQAEFAAGNETKGGVEDHLPRVDPEAQLARLHHWQEVRRALATIRRDDLSPTEQVNFDVYVPQIEVLIASQAFRDYEMPANSDSAFWTDLGYTARRPFRTVDDYRHWIAQMRDIPRYFQEQQAQMRAGLARGFTPPRVTLAGRDAAFDPVTGVAAEQTFFYEPNCIARL